MHFGQHMQLYNPQFGHGVRRLSLVEEIFGLGGHGGHGGHGVQQQILQQQQGQQ